MTTPQEHVVDWLRDAYAMEKPAETMLRGAVQTSRPLSAVEGAHRPAYRGNAFTQQLLETCLDRLGSSPSAMKDPTARMSAFMQGAGGMVVSDEVVKGGMASYLFEHVQIAASTTPIAAANAAGDIETRQICERVLPQEIEMAKWLLERLPQTVTQFVSRSAADRDEAKR